MLYPAELRAPLLQSGRVDSNHRLLAPKASALPDCATPREGKSLPHFPTPLQLSPPFPSLPFLPSPAAPGGAMNGGGASLYRLVQNLSVANIADDGTDAVRLRVVEGGNIVGDHLAPSLQQIPDEVDSQKARAPGHESLHWPLLFRFLFGDLNQKQTSTPAERRERVLERG